VFFGIIKINKEHALTKDEILHYLKENSEEFRTKYSVEKIGLFGSYTREDARHDSDIDIFVRMKPSIFDMIAVKDQKIV